MLEADCWSDVKNIHAYHLYTLRIQDPSVRRRFYDYMHEKGILVPPPLRFDILEEISKRLPGFPIVLHGASSVPQEFVKIINDNGGNMPDAVGVPEDQLRQASKMAVCKINIDSDIRLAMTGTIRQFFNEHPEKFDPREYLKPARDSIREMVKHKIVDVLGSQNTI